MPEIGATSSVSVVGLPSVSGSGVFPVKWPGLAFASCSGTVSEATGASRSVSTTLADAMGRVTVFGPPTHGVGAGPVIV